MPVRYAITLASSVAVGFVGTFAHRMGASSNIPYGLVLALAIVGMSAWCARSRDGVVALALHLMVSSMAAWGMAMGGADGGDATTPVGFSGSGIPYFSQHVGYLWLYGLILVQVVLVVLPARFFNASGRREAGGTRGAPHGGVLSQGTDSLVVDSPVVDSEATFSPGTVSQGTDVAPQDGGKFDDGGEARL